MANNCMLDMRIAGREEAVQQLVKMLRWESPYEETGMGRVFSFDLDPSLTEYDPRGTGYISVQGFGDCAWSFNSAVMESPRKPSFLDVTRRLGLVVEVFTSEPGVGFQEHLMIDKGQVITNECVDYEEHLIEGAEEWYIENLCEEKGMTREELMGKVNHNGEYTEGGFKNYGDFDDLFAYLEPEHKTALQDQISDAAARAAVQNNDPAPRDKGGKEYYEK